MRGGYSLRIGPVGLAVLDIVQHHDYARPTYVITRVNVPERYRGQGHGSALLRQVCDDADRERVVLILEVSSYGDMDNEQLRRWYYRYWFRQVAGRYMLCRLPLTLRAR